MQRKLFSWSGLLSLVSLTIFFSWGIPVHSQESKLNRFCNRFPHNSRCQGYIPPTKPLHQRLHLIDRETFCEQYTFNTLCQNPATEIINYQLGEQEWVRVHQVDNQIKFHHSHPDADILVSLATEGVESLVSGQGF